MAEPSAKTQALNKEILALKTELEAQARADGMDPSTLLSEAYTTPDEKKVRPNMQNMQLLVISFTTDEDAKAWHKANVLEVPIKWSFSSGLRMYYPDPRWEKGTYSVQAKLASHVNFDSNWHARQVFRLVNQQMKALGMVSGTPSDKFIVWRKPEEWELALDEED